MRLLPTLFAVLSLVGLLAPRMPALGGYVCSHERARGSHEVHAAPCCAERANACCVQADAPDRDAATAPSLTGPVLATIPSAAVAEVRAPSGDRAPPPITHRWRHGPPALGPPGWRAPTLLAASVDIWLAVRSLQR